MIQEDGVAEVVQVWWLNDFGGCWKVITKCPLCEKEHGHAINATDVGVRQHRVADCFQGGYFFTVDPATVDRAAQR